jgi:hypothetical protein
LQAGYDVDERRHPMPTLRRLVLGLTKGSTERCLPATRQFLREIITGEGRARSGPCRFRCASFQVDALARYRRRRRSGFPPVALLGRERVVGVARALLISSHKPTARSAAMRSNDSGCASKPMVGIWRCRCVPRGPVCAFSKCR